MSEVPLQHTPLFRSTSRDDHVPSTVHSALPQHTPLFHSTLLCSTVHSSVPQYTPIFHSTLLSSTVHSEMTRSLPQELPEDTPQTSRRKMTASESASFVYLTARNQTVAYLTLKIHHHRIGGPRNNNSAKDAWPFYRTISGVRLCWELEEPEGPKGRD